MVSMGEEGMLSFSVIAVVEDVLRQHGTRLSDLDLASRKAEEASTRRYEATSWLRKIVGVVCSKDLPAEPSEEHFRLGLRSGIILCNAINKVQPGAVLKVVEAPNDTVIIPDGAALMAYQYFENVRNFLVAIEDMGLPTFEASDLEQGGKTTRIVNCVLALKSYNEWKLAGANGTFKFSGSTKTPSGGKGFIRKNSEPFMNSISRTSSVSEKSLDTSTNDQYGDAGLDFSDMSNSHSLNVMIRALLMDKKQDEIPNIVENMLSRVMEEFERRLSSQTESVKCTPETMSVSGQNTSSPTESPKAETQIDEDTVTDKDSESEGETETEAETETETETEQVKNVSEEDKIQPYVPCPASESRLLKESESRLLKESESRLAKESESLAKESESRLAKESESRLAKETESRIANETESRLAKETESRIAKETESRIAKETESRIAKETESRIKETEGRLAKETESRIAKETESRIKETERRLAKETESRIAKETERRLAKALESLLKKQNMLLEKQMNDIQGLKQTVHTTKSSMQLMQTKYRDEFNVLGKHLRTLAHAAAGYQKVLEENRRLYNQVQDLKGNIRVYCRVRPFLPGQASGSTTVDHIEEGNITIVNPVKYSKEGKKTFTFNKVFGPAATQAEVYLDMQPLVRSCLDGYNVCIFAYGQTGSGKTFTMTGPNDLTEETYGVNYRALNDLFHLTEERKATFTYEVSVQMMEIYNEQVRDLLASDEIRNSSQTGINVPDATRLPVSTTDDVINLMNLGHKNRAVSSTAMNDRSSRSHSCMTVHVQGKDLTSGAMLRGCMHLVDLAGSERVDKSEVTGDRLKEAQHINKSLAALGDVIASLSMKNAHVPYRNSKLTQLLQDSLGGQAKTLMFIHMSPEVDAIGETISTLKFAERVSTIELGAARANKDSPSDVKELKEQICTLKAALARKDEDTEQLSRSASTTPETMSVKSTASSPMHPSYRPSKDSPSGRKSPVKDGSNSSKGKSNAAPKPRRKSLDPNDILADTAQWPPLSSVVKPGEKTLTSGDWVEKVITKQNSLDSVMSLETYAEENRNPSENNRQRQRLDGDVQISMFDSPTPDSFDELEIATSDSSEQDFQINLPRAASMPNCLGSKIKKPQVKPSRSPEKKSLIPTAPTRKLSNGTSPPVVKNGRQSVNTKRKTANVK
ncbi:hypothetical protein vseg_009749 [Gypsophila vaccaria]